MTLKMHSRACLPTNIRYTVYTYTNTDTHCYIYYCIHSHVHHTQIHAFTLADCLFLLFICLICLFQLFV